MSAHFSASAAWAWDACRADSTAPARRASGEPLDGIPAIVEPAPALHTPADWARTPGWRLGKPQTRTCRTPGAGLPYGQHVRTPDTGSSALLGAHHAAGHYHVCLLMTTVATKLPQPIRSTIPARLDRLRWSPFHTRLVLGLGTAWILDGLEITIASSVTGKLTQANTLNLSTVRAASIGTVYLVGEVVGALVFGRLSDKLGRRNLYGLAFAGGQPGRPAAARPAVRHPGPPEDDLRHVPDLRVGAGLQRLAVRRGRAARRGPDLHLDRRVLLRLRRGERRLPDGQRDLPGRDPGRGHRGVLRHRPGLRRARHDLLRRADRHRHRPRRPDDRLPDRRWRHDHRWAGRGLPRHRRRRQAAGAGRTTAHRGRLRRGHAMSFSQKQERKTA